MKPRLEEAGCFPLEKIILCAKGNDVEMLFCPRASVARYIGDEGNRITRINLLHSPLWMAQIAVNAAACAVG